MQNVFDITQFGAVGDGVKDCTAQIQAALDAAGTVRGTVVVPPGRYQTGYLQMRPGTMLRADAAWGFGQSGTAVFALCDAGAPCLLDCSHALNATVLGMCVDGGMLGNNIHGLRIAYDVYNGGGHEDAVTIEGCRVAQFSGDGLHFSHAWCFTVRHSHLAFNRGAGLYLDGWDAFLTDNWFSGNSHCGIRGGPVTSSLTLTGNRIEWNRVAGVSLCNGDSMSFTGNFFDRSYGPALTLGDHATNDLFGRCNQPNSVCEVAITGNIFRRSGKPMETPFADVYDSSHLRLTNCRNVTVTGNVFRYGRDDDGGGVDSPEYAVVLDGGNNCTLFANPMEHGSMAKNIVVLEKGVNVTLRDNPGMALHETK